MRGDDLAEAVRSLDDCLQLVRHELPADSLVDVREHGAGRDDLDQIRTPADVLTHDPATVIRARAQGRTPNGRGDIARPRNLAARDPVAEREDGFVVIAQIGDSREARLQRPGREARAADSPIGRSLGYAIETI